MAGELVTHQNLEWWTSTIEARWKWENIPEFEVPAEFKHMAIICDGNRRSAKQKGLAPYEGHRLGLEVIQGTMRACKKWGIRNLTFWTWSTENWKRDAEQVGFVMNLAARHLRDEKAISQFIENKVRFRQIGRSDRLPREVREAIVDLEGRTSNFNEFTVNLALDYGGMDEFARASAKMIEGGVRPEEITKNPEIILNYLDTAGQPLPELVIRTGNAAGEIPHTSGFMPLQTAYAAWTFMPDLFPDLTPTGLLIPVQDFLNYEMRQGK